MRKYEMMVIVDPDLGEDGIEKKIIDIKEHLEKNGAKLESIEEWGHKKFAYPIKKKDEGYYTIFYFEAEPEFSLELRRKIELDREILRQIILRREE